MGNLGEGDEGHFGDTNIFLQWVSFPTNDLILKESSSISKSLNWFSSMHLKHFFTLKFTFILTLNTHKMLRIETF